MAGHSLGGTVAPRVAAAEPSVAGLVLLAGGAQPLQWAAVRQISYLASLAPATAAASQPGIDALTAQARMVDSPDLSPETPDAELPFGVPAPYWLDLRDYDPVAVAAGLPQPMLLVQGGRDYQATVADDLSRWQAGLDRRPDVTIRVYPADNHFFFPGTGPSSPAELAAAQHLDPEVVADVADWLEAQASRQELASSSKARTMAVAAALGWSLVAAQTARRSPPASSWTGIQRTPRGTASAAMPGTTAIPRPAATSPSRVGQSRAVKAILGSAIPGHAPNSGASPERGPTIHPWSTSSSGSICSRAAKGCDSATATPAPRAPRSAVRRSPRSRTPAVRRRSRRRRLPSARGASPPAGPAWRLR